MTARLLAPLGLLIGACATPPPPAETPEPVATSAPSVVVPAVAADPQVAEPAPTTFALPRHLLLEDAVSLTVVDVAGLRRLGLKDSLRLLARDHLGAGAWPCVEPLVAETSRVVMTRALTGNGSAIAVEQPERVETLLDCFAQNITDASAKSIGGRPALELRPGTVAMDVGGTLVLGNEAGLSSLLGVPEPLPPEDEHRRGDVLADEFELNPGDPPGLDNLIAQLPRVPGEPLVTAVQNLGGMGIGGGRAAIHRTAQGVSAHLDILGFGDQMGMLEGVPGAGGDEMMEQVVDSLRRSLIRGLEEREQAAPLLAAVSYTHLTLPTIYSV